MENLLLPIYRVIKKSIRSDLYVLTLRLGTLVSTDRFLYVSLDYSDFFLRLKIIIFFRQHNTHVLVLYPASENQKLDNSKTRL